MTIRIILVDDHAVMREGLRVQIEQLDDMEVVAEADNGRTAVRLAEELNPDVVIMDIRMSGLNGIDATRQIIDKRAGMKVIALSMHPSRLYVAQMLEAGASGYILKDSAFKEIIEAIRGVVAGQTYLSPRIAGFEVADFVRDYSGKASNDIPLLTSREREVLQLLAQSKTNKEIAELLYLNVRTVETYLRKIMDKIDIHDIAGLIRFAIRNRLNSPDS